MPPTASLQSVAIAPTLSSVVPNECGETIATLLNTPIPTLLLVTNQALVLLPALPLIPNRLVEKIKAGHFIEMKEFLGDNIALLQRLEEVQGAPNPQWALPPNSPTFSGGLITSYLISCFLTYTAVRCRDEKTQAFLIYARLVLDLARKHGGRGWLDYDLFF